MSIFTGIGGGVLALIFLAVYLLLIVLTISVLIRLTILLPILTKLAKLGCDRLDPRIETISNDRRLLELEDLLHLNRITPEEYAAKRTEILDNL